LLITALIVSYEVGNFRPHLSISHPHLVQVPPPQSVCLNDFGWRTCGIGEPQSGQFTGCTLIPHLFFVTVPTATRSKPTNSTDAVAIKINMESDYPPGVNE
jgi:hypothetical protein